MIHFDFKLERIVFTIFRTFLIAFSTRPLDLESPAGLFTIVVSALPRLAITALWTSTIADSRSDLIRTGAPPYPNFPTSSLVFPATHRPPSPFAKTRCARIHPVARSSLYLWSYPLQLAPSLFLCTNHHCQSWTLSRRSKLFCVVLFHPHLLLLVCDAHGIIIDARLWNDLPQLGVNQSYQCRKRNPCQ